jgi:hypothetical protein
MCATVFCVLVCRVYSSRVRPIPSEIDMCSRSTLHGILMDSRICAEEAIIVVVVVAVERGFVNTGRQRVWKEEGEAKRKRKKTFNQFE